MEEELLPQGEFHHFQLVNPEGEIPMSISVLVHFNNRTQRGGQFSAPISTEDIIAFHEGLAKFDGDFATAFTNK